MKTLIIMDGFDARADKSALRVFDAARRLGGDVHALIFGAHAEELASKISPYAANIYTYYAPHFNFADAAAVTALILGKFAEYDVYLASADSVGKDVLPRLAMKLDVQPVTDIIDIQAFGTYKRPIYAGNVMVSVEDTQSRACLTVRPTCFEPASALDTAGTMEEVDFALPNAVVGYTLPNVDVNAPVDLQTAEIVLAAGNGVGTKEKFAAVQQLAAKLGAAVGASRALVDSGVAPNDSQVGQTGKIVAPELYIALGISGAVQHMAGMKDSSTIVAVNKDAQAPIMSMADYALVADLDEVLPKLLEAF